MGVILGLRLGVGVMANAASMLLYAAPILTFSKVIKKKSAEGFSCIPYILALFNSSVYTWYGLPVVSYQWENFLLVTINGLGVFLEASFILLYFYYASSAGRKTAAMVAVPVVLVICAVVMISTFAIHDHHHRKVLVGSIGLVASVAMYASPLVVLKQVIRTKSVRFMPFYLSFFSFVSSILWMAFGLLSRDLFIASPNFVGSPLGLLQLMVYCKYRKQGVMEEPQKWDLEKDSINNYNIKNVKIITDEEIDDEQSEDEEERVEEKMKHLEVQVVNKSGSDDNTTTTK